MTTSVWSEVSASPPRAVRTITHRAITALAFFAALAGGCLLLGRSLPFPAIPIVREKLEYLARCGDDYDVLFLGSSRIHFQILPSIFDQIVREHGLPIRSFNAGVGAMFPPEDSYMLEQILRRPHKRLRWVFLEVIPFNRPEGVFFLAGTGRDIYWHDVRRTQWLTARSIEDCKALRRTPDWRNASWPVKLQKLGPPLGIWMNNLRLFVIKNANIGYGSDWLRVRLGLPGKFKEHSPAEDKIWDGWAPPSVAKEFTAKRQAEYQSALASLLASHQRFDPGDALAWELLRSNIDRLAQEKVTPILLTVPTTDAIRYLPPQAAAQSLTVLDFSDPREYPELFALNHRLDGWHLNYEGAELFTKALALKFIETVKNSGQNP